MNDRSEAYARIHTVVDGTHHDRHQMTDDHDTRRRRAKFRANHRGTKEMDWILGRYADAHIDEMDEPNLSTFEELLSVADPEINAWVMDPNTYPQGQFFILLEKIRSFHNISKTH